MEYNRRFMKPPITIYDNNGPKLKPVKNTRGQLEYFVNNIVDAKMREGEVKYCVFWLTYEEDNNTGEASWTLEQCAALLDRWEEYQRIVSAMRSALIRPLNPPQPINHAFNYLAESRARSDDNMTQTLPVNVSCQCFCDHRKPPEGLEGKQFSEKEPLQITLYPSCILF